MKTVSLKVILLAAICLFVLSVNVKSQTCEWVEKIEGSSENNSTKIAIDGAGNMYVAGYFSSQTIKFNNGISISNIGNVDAYIAKYNSSGLCLWAERIAGSRYDWVTDIFVDNSCNIYVTGYFESSPLNFNNDKSLTSSGFEDAYIAKYDSTGTCIWVEKIGGSNHDETYCIKVESSGNIFVGGWFKSQQINFNNNISLNNSNHNVYGDGFIAKYNSSGICQWAEQVAGNHEDKVYSISVDSSGNVYAAGFAGFGTVWFNNGKSLSNSDIDFGFLSKYDSSGVCQWAEKFAGRNSVWANCITVDKYDNVYVSGIFLADTLKFNNGITLTKIGDYNIFLAKYNSSSVCLWAEKITADWRLQVNSIAIDNLDYVYISGNFSSHNIKLNNGIIINNVGSLDNSDCFIAKYNTSGICRWAEHVGGTWYDQLNGLAVDNSYNVYISGVSGSDTLKFNNGKSINKSGSGGFIYLAKYCQIPSYIEENHNNQYSIAISPNPATDYIYIQPSEGWQPSEGSDIQIFDMLGVLVLTVEQTPPSVQRIDISNLSLGMYFIRIGNRVEKFVKM